MVNPRNTSSECSQCGQTGEDLPEDHRTFHCHRHGLAMDRDWNAAITIRNRAFGL